jgi:hypothetical protein
MPEQATSQHGPSWEARYEKYAGLSDCGFPIDSLRPFTPANNPNEADRRAHRGEQGFEWLRPRNPLVFPSESRLPPRGINCVAT